MNLARSLLACALTVAPASLFAKPIAYAQGTTVMAEYGGGTMTEAQVFHAPRYDWSLGAGYLELDSDFRDRRREISYARVNHLVHRWNLEDAQANVFAWGGAGSAYVSETRGHATAWNAGLQVDYETRRLYGSFKTDLHLASSFTHRIDTLQLGIAPYEHDYDTLATWFVIQGRRYTGGIHEGAEWALLLRLFKRGAWLDAGVTQDGKLQAMVMTNF
jgi:hypothetical protein